MRGGAQGWKSGPRCETGPGTSAEADRIRASRVRGLRRLLDRFLQRGRAVRTLPREQRGRAFPVLHGLGRATEVTVRGRRRVDRLAQVERGGDAARREVER